MVDQKYRPLVISGPSGSGKSTLLNRLFAEFPETFGFSVSHTTRSARPGEEPGKQYHFVDRESFQKLIDEGKLIEHAEFGGNLYGTSVEAVKTVAEAGKVAVLDVDMQGVKSVKGTDLNARFIFIKPPSTEVLEQRLRGRGTETEEAVKDRLALAKAEMEYADQPGSHDIIIVNDVLDEAYGQLRTYVTSITSPSDPKPGTDAPENQTTNVVEQVAPQSSLTVPDPLPTLQAVAPDTVPSVSPAPASDKIDAKAAKKEKEKKEKKEKEAKEKERKEKEKEEKAKKAKEKEEKSKKSKGAKNAGNVPATSTSATGGENTAAGSASDTAPVSATPSGNKKSKTCTIL